MRIKDILRIVKRKGTARIRSGGGEQWLEAGGGIYALTGIPPLTADILLTLMDIPADKRGGYDIKEVQGDDDLPLNLRVSAVGEIETAPEQMTVSWIGVEHIPFLTDRGAIFVDRELLCPFSDEAVYTVRRTCGGQAYLFVREGIFAAGAVMPRRVGHTVPDEDQARALNFADRLSTLASAAEAELGGEEEAGV